MKSFLRTCTILFLSYPVISFAHTGLGEHHFADGFIHPFLGVDHLIAMLIVGIWGVLNDHRVWVMPACFITFLGVGAVAGQSGYTAPALETIVAGSVVAFGLMLALRLKPGVLTTMMLIAVSAYFHGLAHGAELATGLNVLAGIVLGSALLHILGIMIAMCFLMKRPELSQRLGKTVAILGSYLVFSSII